MNFMLVNVVDDITSKTGLSIIKASIDGERAPKIRASLRDGRCKKDEYTIALALVCNYKDDQLFLLGKNLRLYEFFC